MSKMIRINETTQTKLNKLHKITGRSKQALMEQAINNLARDAFFDAANKSYENLRNNKEAWQEELEERALWESASLQDLIKADNED